MLDMETLKENGKFYFSASEILNENQIRSFFSRLKREGQIAATRNLSVGNVVIKDKLVKNPDPGDDDDEEIDAEVEALEQDFQDVDSALERIKILENLNVNAKIALESSLLMNSYDANSSRTLKKNN